jgi:sorting nexin-7/30/sorting nexin-8
MEDNTEEEKQNYLRENILEKGYDAEDFVSYLTIKKGDDGVNLSNWTLEELKSLVQEYILVHPQIGINQINPQIQQNINSTQVQNQIPIQNLNMNMNQIMNINNGINNNLNVGMDNSIINNNVNNEIINNNGMAQYGNVEDFNQENEPTDIYGITNLESISCSIYEKSELCKFDNIKIEMTIGERVPGTFFSKAYTTYIIVTSPANLKVRRRYSDFEWLRQVLINLYSSNVIPPIPKKNKIGGDRFDELFLDKRLRTLEKFINLLLTDPIIRDSQILYDFLSIEEESKFNNRKKYYSNYKLPMNLCEFKSPNGKLNITINEEVEIFYQNIKDNTELNQDLLTKLNTNIKQLSLEMTNVFNRMDEIAKICDELFINSIKYYDINDIKVSYCQLKDMFKNWSTALKKECVLLNVNVREYFKYSKNLFRSMKEMLNIVDFHKQTYYKSKRNLITKKEELFKRSDVSKWDLGPNKNISIVSLLKDKNVALPKMLYSETKVVNNMKQMYGYYLNRATGEFERIRKLIGLGHRQNISENSNKQITIISELFKNLSDIAVCSQKYDIKNIEKDIEKDLNMGDHENQEQQQ